MGVPANFPALDPADVWGGQLTDAIRSLHLSGAHAAIPAANAVPTNSLYSCSTHNVIHRTDGSTWTDWAAIGGGGTAVKFASSKYNSGTIPVNTTTLSQLTNSGGTGGPIEVSIAAAAGDVLDIGLNCQAADANNTWIDLNVATFNGSTEVNRVGGTGTTGSIAAWSIRANDYNPQSASVPYTVQAADVVSGMVKLRLLGLNGSGTNRALFSTAAAPLVFYVFNLGNGSSSGGGSTASTPLSPTYLGKNSIGASTENVTLARQYAKKITATGPGVLNSVQAYLSQAADSSFTVKGLVWADNAGTPGLLLGASYATDLVTGAGGWRSFPVDIELVAGNSYWIGFVVSARPIGSGSMQVAYDAGGSDRYQQSGTAGQIGDWTSGWGPATTANDYSIRGLVSSGGGVTTAYPPGSADKPPTSPNSKDDEFDGTSSVVWSDTPTVAATFDLNVTRKSHAYVKATSVAYVGKIQPIPASYPFTITMKVPGSTARANYQRGGGIIIGPAAPVNGNDLIYLGPVYNDSQSNMGVWRIKAQFGGTFGSQTGPILRTYWGPFYMKMRVNSATSVDMWGSTDGFNWMQVELGLNPGFTPGVMGFALNDEAALIGCETFIDFFRVS